MALVIGQPIDARELEQATSGWSPERFASMCDSLSWAISGRACPSLPDFTMRVNAPDGGVDAEWFIDVPDDGRTVPTPIVGPGWNVFQYKRRDLLAQDRRRVISSLKSLLEGAVNEVVKHHNRHPSRYTLFVNVDLKSNEKAALMDSIIKDYLRSPKLHVEIVGSAELAAFLNDYPHIRAAYFTPLSFKTWREAYDAHRVQKRFGVDAELIGRETELKRLKALVDDPQVRAIIVSGPPDMGKTRLALEATKHRPRDVVLALDPRSMSLSDYRSLCSDRADVVCIVEDPEPDDLRSLINEAMTLTKLKLLITLPAANKVPTPAYGRDERVQSLHLGPLTEESCRALLKASGQSFDFGIEDWIISHAAGIPGVLLAAAAVGRELRSNAANFSQAVGNEFERRIQEELGSEALKCARLISVLDHVGVSGAFASELELVCELLGEGWAAHNALGVLTELEKAGLAKRGGSFAEITLPLLANHLVSQLLRGRRHAVFALFARLNEQGRLRFIGRLSQIKSTEVELFWDAVFASDGLFGTVQAVQSNAHILKLVAGTVPGRTLRVLESVLRGTTKEERQAIAGDQRRELMWALEQLLFRAKTSAGALRLIWLLAEAENENYGNNATGVFKECFHPFQPQLPLPLSDRIELLKEFASEEASKEGKIVAIEAIGDALRRGVSFQLRHSSGPEPLDSMPSFTYEELGSYLQNLVDILFDLAKDDGEVAAVALGALPEVTAEFGIQVSPKAALERLRRLTDWARSGKPGLDVSSLFGAFSFLRNALSEYLNKTDFPSDRQSEFHQYIADLERLKTDLESGDFAIRLKHCAGRWTWTYDLDMEEPQADGRLRFEIELQKLAREAIEKPDSLNSDLIEWLISPDSQRSHVFFYYLGVADTNRIYQTRIEQLGQRPEGTDAFSSYWGGWAQQDRPAAEARLDELATSNGVTGEAIVLATGRLGAGPSAVVRVINQLQLRRIGPDYAASVLQLGRWLDGLSEEQFYILLKAIATENFEHGASTLRMLGMWMHLKRPIHGDLADFAWRCLEHDPRIKSSSDAWHIDQLAAKLAQDDPERGFQLLKNLILVAERDRSRWDPLGLNKATAFWKVLHAKDKQCLIGFILDAAQTNDLIRIRVSWRLQELLDQDGDKDVLLSFARRNVDRARIIASWMTSAKPGFWPLAVELHTIYPQDERLHNSLAAGIEQMGSVIRGPMSQFYESRRFEVEQKLGDPSIPSSFRAWLREMIERLEKQVSSEIVWEYDLDANDLRTYIQDKDSAQRIWAIGRVLKYAQLEDIRRLLTVEDIEEALPQVDLPEKRRKMLEQAIPVWRRGK